jgi:hypothetical protein
MEGIYELECEEHGGYFATPDKTNCPLCGCDPKQDVKTKEFIRKARLKFGEKFNYALVKYETAKIDVIIICPVHNQYIQKAELHLRSKYGCQECSKEMVIKSNKARAKTTEQFIEDAKKVHNDTYDYSKVKYEHTDIDVIIICQKHGKFEQSPHSHLSGQGCPDCGRERTNAYIESCKKTTEQFIEDAQEKHGDRYDYSKTEYKGSNEKVKIICRIHGEFDQRAADHTKGLGCEKCKMMKQILANKARMKTTEQFIEEAREKHGNRYDYSKSEYKGSNEKVKIICQKHGKFKQRANDHTRGSGCKQCGIIISGTEEYIELAKKVHGDRYDYSLVKYKRTDVKVKIICLVHGKFKQRAAGHLEGKGCPKCGAIQAHLSKRLTQEQVLKRFQMVHGDTYDYSKFIYDKNNVPSVIICKLHGEFPQRPGDHWNGSGCSRCGIKNKQGFYSQSSITWMNLISQYKNIDIQHAENDREEYISPKDYGLDSDYPEFKYFMLDGICHSNSTVFEFNGCLWHGCPECFPTDEEHPINKKSMKDLYDRTLKKEEIIRKIGYNIITIWEHEFREIIKNGEDPKNNPILKKYLDTLQF